MHSSLLHNLPYSQVVHILRYECCNKIYKSSKVSDKGKKSHDFHCNAKSMSQNNTQNPRQINSRCISWVSALEYQNLQTKSCFRMSIKNPLLDPIFGFFFFKNSDKSFLYLFDQLLHMCVFFYPSGKGPRATIWVQSHYIGEKASRLIGPKCSDSSFEANI